MSEPINIFALLAGYGIGLIIIVPAMIISGQVRIRRARQEIRDLADIWRFNMSDHLWIEDGERIVCTHCGITLKEGLGDECHDTPS